MWKKMVTAFSLVISLVLLVIVFDLTKAKKGPRVTDVVRDIDQVFLVIIMNRSINASIFIIYCQKLFLNRSFLTFLWMAGQLLEELRLVYLEKPFPKQ